MLFSFLFPAALPSLLVLGLVDHMLGKVLKPKKM